MPSPSTNPRLYGHAAALSTALIWGTTFLSSKVVLTSFTALETLLMRFVLGFALLCLISPKRPARLPLKQEIYFIGAGLTGVTGYYLIENIALTKTLASIVSVITCTAPFFTAIAAFIFLKQNKMNRNFFLGFLVAIVGICFISFAGTDVEFNLPGTLLSVLGACVWAIYSIFVEKAAGAGLPSIEMTKRFFFYGLLFMIPCALLMGFSPDLAQLTHPAILLNLLALGFIGSGVCFVTWNKALASLGTVEAGVYIYLVPVITVVASMLLLDETLTAGGIIGTVLTLAGLIISEKKGA